MNSTRPLHTPFLVNAFKSLADIYTHRFADTLVEIISVSQQGDYEFRIGDYGKGTVSVVGDTFTITRFTSHLLNIAYSEYYRSRHGNNELMVLLEPLLVSRLRPAISQRFQGLA